MHDHLTGEELVALVQRVFQPTAEDRRLVFLLDLPDATVADTPAWAALRALTFGWYQGLTSRQADAGLEQVSLLLYRNVRANNAELPAQGVVFQGEHLPACAEELTGEPVEVEAVLASHSLVLAPTRFSTTAPLKLLARRLGFRAATMPGFSAAMVPALRLDYGKIGRRCDRLKALLDEATGCELSFETEGESLELFLDLRYRSAHASGGVLPLKGTAGNLPSGESYIVPYEGERTGEPSQSRGVLPVQLGEEVVRYRIESNQAVGVLTDGPRSRLEARLLQEEPAYGNLAELGLGVLGDFGLEPTGETLLDEKLGLHIAFGRSDHFGGQVAPKHFSAPEKVVHIDRVYTSSLQPKVSVKEAWLQLPGGARLLLMREGVYQVGMED